MFTYSIRKLLVLIPMLLVISFLIYGGLELMPGDAVSFIAGPEAMANMSPEKLDALREALGLNKPFLIRYLNWLGGVLRIQSYIGNAYCTNCKSKISCNTGTFFCSFMYIFVFRLFAWDFQCTAKRKLCRYHSYRSRYVGFIDTGILFRLMQFIVFCN